MDVLFFSSAADREYKQHKKQIKNHINTTMEELARVELQTIPDLYKLDRSSINNVTSLMWIKIRPTLKASVKEKYPDCFEEDTGSRDEKLNRLLAKSHVKFQAYVASNTQPPLLAEASDSSQSEYDSIDTFQGLA